MKDRQFMIILGLVVAAGLVMGLVAFRMTGGAPAPVVAAAGNSTVAANPNAPRPSSADEMADQPVDAVAPSLGSDGSQNSEPEPARADPPEMQGPANGDPPGTAATEPSQPSGAPAEATDSTLQ